MEKTHKSAAHGAAISIRVPTALKTRLESEAASKARSFSAEIEYRLQRSLDTQDLLTEALTLKYGDALAAKLIKFGDHAHALEVTERMMTNWRLDEKVMQPVISVVRQKLREFHLDEAEGLN